MSLSGHDAGGRLDPRTPTPLKVLTEAAGTGHECAGHGRFSKPPQHPPSTPQHLQQPPPQPPAHQPGMRVSPAPPLTAGTNPPHPPHSPHMSPADTPTWLTCIQTHHYKVKKILQESMIEKAIGPHNGATPWRSLPTGAIGIQKQTKTHHCCKYVSLASAGSHPPMDNFTPNANDLYLCVSRRRPRECGDAPPPRQWSE
ncbi:hypothetical protein GWK47_006076 [Chionoecetes opilio]|uniref:Uncharacterized protein n=1 Tax=Chionoecetes opilio TaxID=41210 RepID=A0A8J5CV80_CHIOP|nr:hypothetical protein GWK47_006076 [Chionoecetes opilio]